MKKYVNSISKIILVPLMIISLLTSQLAVAQVAEPSTAKTFEIGYKYLIGDGVSKNHEYGVELILKAAEQGYVPAQALIGLLWLEAKEYPEALKWFQKAAEQNQPYSQGQLGIMYSKGLGVIKNHERAVYWLKKAAEQKDKEAIEYYNKTYNPDGTPKPTFWEKHGDAIENTAAITAVGVFITWLGNKFLSSDK